MAVTKKKRSPRPVVDSSTTGHSVPTKKKKKVKKKAPKKKGMKKSTSKFGPEDYLKTLRSMKGVDKSDFAMFSEEIVNTQIAEFFSTGSLAIDRQIGGGWPVTRITEVASWEGVGKSTLLDMSLAQCQRMNGIACLIDTEKARDLKYTRMLGVDPDKLLAAEVDTLEEGFEQIERMLEVQEQVKKKSQGTPPPMLIVWDSIGGTASISELKGSSEDKHVGSAARVIKMNLRRLTQRISDLRVALVIANHFYEKIGAFGGGLTTYGGSGVRYFTTLRLWLTRTGNVTISNDVVGHTIKAKLKKTRIQNPCPDIETALIYGAGIDNSFTLFEWAKKAFNEDGHPWVQQQQAHYWLYPPGEDPIHFQRQFFGLGEIFQSRPELYRKMATQFLSEL